MNKSVLDNLQNEFTFMNRENSIGTYHQFGFECLDGWYNILHDLCQEIQDRYQKENKEVDIVVLQIKEKFGTLRFYYTYKDNPRMLCAVDFLGKESVRLNQEENPSDENAKKLSKDIREIVDKYEEKSAITCEFCGDSARLRNVERRFITLCDKCTDEYTKMCQKHKDERRKITAKHSSAKEYQELIESQRDEFQKFYDDAFSNHNKTNL